MAATVLIRTSKLTDADAVSDLLSMSYPNLLANSYDSDLLHVTLPYMTKANPTLLVSGTYYVAETDRGILVGCGGWTTQEPGSGEIIESEAHIRHFAIHPEWTRRGIGTSILTRCVTEARSFGVRTLHCFSTLNAEPFYRAANFQTVRRIDVPMGEGIIFPAVLMQCKIA